MMEIFSGFLLGILGGVHCIGMCGPLALAAPHTGTGRYSNALDGIAYSLGRISTYTFMGVLIGLVGNTLGLAGYQNGLSITLGLIIIIFFLIPIKIKSNLISLSKISRLTNRFKLIFNKFLRINNRFSLFSLGLLNGLLPCGLVYSALAGALAMADFNKSVSFMLFFGLGTFPVMFVIYFGKNLITIGLRQKLKKLVPIGILTVAFLLVLRGMSLGIPYVSPVLHDKIVEKSKCCD